MADEAPDWAKAEIAEAVRILREDGVHIHKTYAQFQASLGDKSGDKGTGTETESEETETEGNPPPGGAKNEPPKRKGLWWSDRV
jgi:hypothetical protein